MRNGRFLILCLVVAAAYWSSGSPKQHGSVPQTLPNASVVPRQVQPDTPPIADQDSVQKVAPERTKSPPSTTQGFANLQQPNSSMFVRASKLNVRSVPSPSAAVAGQVYQGAQVSVLEVREGWVRIETHDRKIKGWVSSNFLQKTKPVATQPKPKKPKQPQTVQPLQVKTKAKAIDTGALVQQIIAASINGYSGSCPCPYNTMRNGRRCGGRSAYSRPGGQSPICYPEDVTSDMITAWTANR